MPGSGTQSWAENSQVDCHRTVASHPGVVCSWPQSLPVQAVALLGPGEQDLGVRAVTEGGRVWMGMASVLVLLLVLKGGPHGNGCSIYPVASPPTLRSPLHLVELGQHRASLLLFLVLLHLGLQPSVVLQGLFPPFHCHVEAREYAAEPVGYSLVRNRLLMWGCIRQSLLTQKHVQYTYYVMCQSHKALRLWGLYRWDDVGGRQYWGLSSDPSGRL